MDGTSADYVPPSLGLGGFNCPHCGAYSHHLWEEVRVVPGKERFHIKLKEPVVGRPKVRVAHTPIPGGGRMPDALPSRELDHLSFSKCLHCDERTIWVDDRVVYPMASTAPLPSKEMPQEVRNLYMEAREIYPRSPRAAAALLRVALEKLTVVLKANGENLYERIASLEAQGLPKTVVKAMDILRLEGNKALHPGEIDLQEGPDVAGRLFVFLNLVVLHTITTPATVEELYSSLPDAKKKQIEQRQPPRTG